MTKLILNRQEIFINAPLYTTYNLKDIEQYDLAKFFWKGSVDAFCPECKKESVFRIQGPPSYEIREKSEKFPKLGIINLEARCTRERASGISGNCDYELLVCFRRDIDELVKIGQHPSKAELDFGTLDVAFKELVPYLRKELGTAIGLFSHGVGIGAFVYLRRIFEKLIEEAYQEAKAENKIDDDKYNNKRMTEKIKLLKGYLPTRLVKSAKLYGILSKGIHELSEEECKDMFPVVKQAIQLILKERHEDKEYEKVLHSLD